MRSTWKCLSSGITKAIAASVAGMDPEVGGGPIKRSRLGKLNCEVFQHKMEVRPQNHLVNLQPHTVKVAIDWQ